MNPHKLLGHIQINENDKIKNAIQFDYGKFLLNCNLQGYEGTFNYNLTYIKYYLLRKG